MPTFAIIGCGGIVDGHAKQLKAAPDVEVVALVDPVAANRAKYKTLYFPDAEEYDGPDDLFSPRAAGSVDAVLIATPHTLHHAHARAALEHGCHVLIEKPMVTSSADAYDLWRAVERTGRKLAIAYQSPYSAEFQYLGRALPAGELGRVQLVSGVLSQGWLGKPPYKSWRKNPALSGGGQMYDSGAHLLNAMMFLMNEPVAEVMCRYDKLDSPVDINGVAIVTFAGGAMATICIGGNCPDFHNEIVIQTDKLRVTTNMYGQFVEMRRAGGKRFYPPVDNADAAVTPVGNFLAALRGEAEVRSPVRYGVLLSALMDAMYESAEKGAPVQVKPVPETLDAT